MPPGQDVLRAAAREWLLTDGAGGSALGTADGVATRRTHALLHVPDAIGVTTLLLGFDQRLLVERDTFLWFAPEEELAAESARAGTIEEFVDRPWPRWRIACGEATLECSLFLLDGHHALAASWRHVQGPAGRLRLGPRIVARSGSELQRETPEMRGVARGIPGRVRIETLEGQPDLTLWYNGTFLPIRQWRRGIRYPDDPPSKPAALEDAFIPGFIDCRLAAGEAVHVVVARDEALFRTLAVEGRLGTPPPSTLSECVRQLEQREVARQRQLESVARRGAEETVREATAARRPEPAATRVAPGDDRWTGRLSRALHRSLVNRAGRPTLIDGFPAATESAARTLRALPAVIALRQFDVARAILRGYLDALDDGLVPAGFGPDGRPHYGDPAASLWLVSAAELLARRSEDADWAQRVMAPLESILHFYRNGSSLGPRVDKDGLLAVQRGDQSEKPALLNVLWYHALVAMAQLARFTGRKEGAAFYLAWARQHGTSFNDRLWDEEGDCLYRMVDDRGPQPGLDREQAIALALTPSILPPERATRLLARLDRELVTPWGLRATPAATKVETDGLPGFYSALLRLRGRDPETLERVLGGLEALGLKLDQCALDDVPRLIPLAEPAERPARKPARKTAEPAGMSMVAAAELLRLWIEDLDHAREPVPGRSGLAP